MTGWAAALLMATLAAPETVTRGTLLEWEGAAASGQLSVRAADHRVFVFLFDAATAFERDARTIPFSALARGDTIEVIAGEGPATMRRYARAVRVLTAAPPRPALRRPLPSWPQRLVPRGNLALAGLVANIQEDRLRLRTRAQGDQIVLLRGDTRFLSDGRPADQVALKVNTRVFIRAGKTLENEVEAYEVIWGEILAPR